MPGQARDYLLLCGLGALAVIATALASEVFGGLVPCALCLDQRLPYYVGVALLGFAWVMRRQTPLAAFSLLLPVAAIFLIGACLGAYHAGVEYHWWAGPTACGGGVNGGDAMGVNAAQELLQALVTSKPVRCDEPTFTLFGVSMAGYNFIASCGLAGCAIVGYRVAIRAFLR